MDNVVLAIRVENESELRSVKDALENGGFELGGDNRYDKQYPFVVRIYTDPNNYYYRECNTRAGLGCRTEKIVTLSEACQELKISHFGFQDNLSVVGLMFLLKH